MEPWRKALWKFLEPWKKKRSVRGFMACGSFVTGGASPRSDVDVHIILDDSVDWRERGNRIVNGFLIEYFANPPRQILEYFREDHQAGYVTTVTQFVNGEILWDPDGVVARLKKEARKWIRKKFPRPSRAQIELWKYHVWDDLDSIEEAFEDGSPSLGFLYFRSLGRWLGYYCKFVGYPLPKDCKVVEMLSRPETREKYLFPEFPDRGFLELFVRAVSATIPEDMVERARALARYVLEKMGGFEIDGWRVRTRVGSGMRRE